MTSITPKASDRAPVDDTPGASTSEVAEAPEDLAPLMTMPSDGVPDVVEDVAAVAAAAARLTAGSGPVAVDAERASGYRYSQRAYLIQLRRDGSGTVLLDPIAAPDLRPVQDAIGAQEWVLHAASQDLPCLLEVGLRPLTLFDTELAGRLAGFERVGLGAMVEKVLGVRLEKGHSAADWSRRPLPEPWLRYAALDVELLVALRDELEAELRKQGKLEWAHEEFAALLTAPPKEPRAEPWRRTSGIHRLRARRQLAAVRAMWAARDEMARRRDIAPGRVLPDAAIIDAVLAAPTDAEALARLPVFSGPRLRRTAGIWSAALRAAAALPDADLPLHAPAGGDGLPPVNRWSERDPAAAARLVRVRAALGAIATEHTLPVENLLEPALTRRLAWSPPADLDEVPDVLAAAGARPWQRALTGQPLIAALATPPPAPEPAPEAADGDAARAGDAPPGGAAG